jgi:hypothetical protein
MANAFHTGDRSAPKLKDPLEKIRAGEGGGLAWRNAGKQGAPSDVATATEALARLEVNERATRTLMQSAAGTLAASDLFRGQSSADLGATDSQLWSSSPVGLPLGHRPYPDAGGGGGGGGVAMMPLAEEPMEPTTLAELSAGVGAAAVRVLSPAQATCAFCLTWLPSCC